MVSIEQRAGQQPKKGGTLLELNPKFFVGSSFAVKLSALDQISRVPSPRFGFTTEEWREGLGEEKRRFDVQSFHLGTVKDGIAMRQIG